MRNNTDRTTAFSPSDKVILQTSRPSVEHQTNRVSVVIRNSFFLVGAAGGGGGGGELRAQSDFAAVHTASD